VRKAGLSRQFCRLRKHNFAAGRGFARPVEYGIMLYIRTGRRLCRHQEVRCPAQPGHNQRYEGAVQEVRLVGCCA
jgi:hypothetical protein